MSVTVGSSDDPRPADPACERVASLVRLCVVPVKGGRKGGGGGREREREREREGARTQTGTSGLRCRKCDSRQSAVLHFRFS